MSEHFGAKNFCVVRAHVTCISYHKSKRFRYEIVSVVKFYCLYGSRGRSLKCSIVTYKELQTLRDLDREVENIGIFNESTINIIHHCGVCFYSS